jgi:parvulin-like peptidyl-prolyl isomerase
MSFLLDNITSSRQYQVVSTISYRLDSIPSSRQYPVVSTISRFAGQMTNYASPVKKYLGGDVATGWSAAELTRFTQIFLVLLVVIILLVSCNDAEQPTALPTVDVPTVVATAEQPQENTSVSQEASAEPTATPTDIPPTATPEPMAALVNGKPIRLVDFEKDVARFQQAQEELGMVAVGESTDIPETVLEALIETEIIAQAAEAGGINITEQMVIERVADLKVASGGDENFAAWLQANQWSEEEFHLALKAEMVTEKMVSFITADVPYAVEQVHARYLQVDDPVLAQSLLEQAQSGADFASLAQQYSIDRVTGDDGGDLGFFAKGMLLVPEVETAAFDLQPGALSEVIAASRSDGTGTAYYLVQLIERDPQREISANFRSQLLQQSFEKWLAEQWTQAEVIRFVGDNQ